MLDNKLMKVFADTGVAWPENDMTDLESVGVDSVLLLNLIVNIEKEFNIQIPDEKLHYDNFKTLPVLRSFLVSILPIKGQKSND